MFSTTVYECLVKSEQHDSVYSTCILYSYMGNATKTTHYDRTHLYRVLSCARFLCNRARELLERAALEALDAGLLEEIALHAHRCALFIYELEQLAFIARVTFSASSLPLSLCLSRCSHSASFLCVSLSLSATLLAERQVSTSVSASTSSSRLSLSSFKLRLHIYKE